MINPNSYLSNYYKESSFFFKLADYLNHSVFMILALLIIFGSCKENIEENFSTNNFGAGSTIETDYVGIVPAADRIAVYAPLLRSKKVGLVVNQTSAVGDRHLLDSLLSLEVDVAKVYTPEHGFTGTADAGEKIADSKRANIPIVSLYGKKKKPSPEDLAGIDILVFDIQDVGVRFYTYISTLHYIMEAAAENHIPLIVLDRPNPNGFYVDGPILESAFKSFVGMHPVPVVYGMSIGEYATMINGEGWLEGGQTCDLKVIECKYYDHTMTYDLPIKPSPNLPNLRSILLYPSLCFFEGTTVSVGRGTDQQFQLFGHPALKDKMPYKFTPVSKPGAKSPKHMGKECYGMEFHHMDSSTLHNDKRLQLGFLLRMYKEVTATGEDFFLVNNNFFDKLAGSESLKKMISQGFSEEEIVASWQDDLEKFKQVRAKYLLYDDFK